MGWIGGSGSDNAITDIVCNHVIFDDNDARNTNTSYGGAIAFTNYSNGSDITLNNCEFLNNDGGAVGCIGNYASAGDVITININNCICGASVNHKIYS